MRLGDMEERKLTGGEKRSKEAHYKKLKKHKGDFMDRYGDEGESVMHAIATKRAKGESVEAEGYEVLPRMDREKYQKRDGLEGPIMTRSGKVVYYDPKEGKYYDPDTDMYMSYEDWKMLDMKTESVKGRSESVKNIDNILVKMGADAPSDIIADIMHWIDAHPGEDLASLIRQAEGYYQDELGENALSEKDTIKPFDTISARAIRDLKQRYPHAKDPVNALVLDIEKNEMDSDRADDEADQERESIMSRIAKIEKELGITEKFMSRRPGTDTVNKAIAIAKKMKGNMTGAVKAIEKIRQGLSDEPSVANALRMANEDIQSGKDAAMVGARVLASLEAIVRDKSAMAVKFMDGQSKVDLFTASAVLQVYNGVNDKNKQKLLNLMSDRQGFVKAAKIAFKMSENTEMKIENIKENRLGFKDIEKFGKENASKIDMEARRRGSAKMEPGKADELRYKIAKEMGLVESKLNEGVLDDTDEDGWMAKSQLYKAAKYAIKLHAMISDTDNLEPWVQAKITKASDYLQVVKHYMEYEGMNPYPMESLQEDNEEAVEIADHYFDMAKQDDANDGMDGSYFRQVARAVFRGDPQEMRDIILDGDTEPRERVLDHMARNHPDMLRKIFPKDADNASYLATMREAEEKHYMCVHAKKGTHKCTADSTYAAAKKAAKMWNMNSTAGIDVKLMDEPQTATEGSYGKKKKKYEGHSPHKKGTAKYKKHMAAMHANSAKPKGKMIEGKVKVTNIKWDSDDDVSDLSTTMMVPVPSGMDKEGAEEFIADYITDKTGVTHDGFKIEESKSQGDAWYIEQDARRMAEKDGHDWESMPYGRKSVYRTKAAEMRKGDDEDMYENTEKQLEKQAIDFFTSIKSKINTTGSK